jgi:hypothetical protein
VRAADADTGQLTYWTADWLERIKNLYAADEQLMAAWNAAVAPGPAAAARPDLDEAHEAWDEAIGVIDQARA